MKESQVVEQAEINHEQVNRRQFLITAGLAGGGLLLKCSLHPTEVLASESAEAAKVIPLSAWLKIGTDDSVTIIVSQAEMGQGIRTTLPAVLAEELGADWSRVRLEDSPTDPSYRNPRINWQFTGNSESTPSFFELMLQMGASAREMLISAAAQKWSIDPATCRTEAGKVIHKNSRRSARFGDLVEAASRITPPSKPSLKNEKDWSLLGKALPRVEMSRRLIAPPSTASRELLMLSAFPMESRLWAKRIGRPSRPSMRSTLRSTRELLLPRAPARCATTTAAPWKEATGCWCTLTEMQTPCTTNIQTFRWTKTRYHRALQTL
jgi:hypothetical protein